MRPIRRAAAATLGLALAMALALASGLRPAHAAGLTSFSPSGDVGLVREVRAVFSEPMTRLGDSGAPDPFVIDCAVKGDSRWVDNRTWVHVFRVPPRAGTRCGFTLRPELRTLAGEALSGRARHEFSTGGPAVVRSMPWEGSRIDEDQSFLLVLTGPVDPDSVVRKAWCRAAGVGERVPVRLLPPAERDLLARRFAPEEPDVLALACARPLPPQARVDLVWDAGIATPSGVSTRRAQSLGYEVRSAFSARLSCPRENASAPCTPLGDIRIEFSAPVARAQAAAVRLTLGDTERKPRLEGGADAPTVEAVVFPGPWPESASVRVSLPPGLRDADQRALTNASAFPMVSRIGAYPPLAKFAAAPFGIIELDEAPAMPLALRKVERALTLREAQPGRGLVRDLRLQDDAAIIAWYSKVLRLHETVIEPALARELTGQTPPAGAATASARPGARAPAPAPVATRTLSLLAREPGARSLSLPEPEGGGERPFELIGVPLPEPGFHVLEVESRLLGRALLERDAPMYVRTAALVTNLAVHHKQGRDNALVWVTRLDRGQPVAGAEVRISDCRARLLWSGRTDAQGLARVPVALPEPAGECGEDRPGHFVSARARDAQGREDLSFAWTGWQQGIEAWRFELPVSWSGATQAAAHTVFDRVLLRAGETVSMKHFVRAHASAGLRRPAPAQLPANLVIVHEGSGQSWQQPLSWQGGAAHSQFTVPPGARLGRYQVYLEQAEPAAGAPAPLWPGRLASGSFRVEAFRLPVFDARVTLPASPPPAARELAADLRVAWLAGGSAAGLPVRVSARLSPHQPAPEGWEGFAFSRRDLESEEASDPDAEDSPARRAAADQRLASRGIHRERLVLNKQAVTLDDQGGARVRLANLPAMAVPHRLEVEASFTDPSGEIQSVARSTVLQPAALMVGIKADGWRAPGQALGVRVAVLDARGQALKGREVRLRGRLERVISHRKRLVGGFYAYENRRVSRDLGELCRARTAAGGVAMCELTPSLAPGEAGELVLVASALDDAGLSATASASSWLSEQGEQWFDAQAVDRIDLIPEKRRLAPGETARLQVRMPFRQATALVTVEREGVIDARVMELRGTHPVIELPMLASYGPNVFVSVMPIRGRLREVPWYSFFRWGWRSPAQWWQEYRSAGELPAARLAPTATVDLARPAFRLGITELQVGIDGSRLAVRVAPERDTWRVREQARVNLDVRLPDGRTPAAGAEVAVAVVDEALLELMPNSSWQLLEAMMQRRPLAVQTATAQMQVVGKRHYGRKAVAAGGDGGRNPTRELFDTLLYWNPAVKLDAQGRAQLSVPLNDSLSRFRVVAIADAGESLFGTGEAVIRTHQPLQIVAALPGVVREGDSLPAEVVVRNHSAQPMTVTLNATARPDDAQAAPVLGTQRSLTLPAGSAQSVTLPLTVPGGAARLLWTLQASEPGGQRDSLSVSQTVAPAVPATVRQALLQAIEGQADIALASPAGALPGSTRLRATLSAGLGGASEGARDWLTRYPYRCLEQRAARAAGLADAGLWRALVDEMPSHLDEAGLLQFFPVRDGERAAGSDSLTAYMLQLSADSGLALPSALREKLIAGLAAYVEGRVRRPGWSARPDTTERRLAALAALARHGRAPMAQVAALGVDPVRLPLSGLIDWLTVLDAVPALPQREALRAQAEQLMRARLVSSGTQFALAPGPVAEPWWLLSNDDSAMARLLLLTRQRPGWQADAPRLALGLLARQRQGAWSGTPGNGWGLLALRRFSESAEATPVSGSTRLRLAGEQREHAWRDGAQAQLTLPVPSGDSRLQVIHSGSGRPWLQAQLVAAVPLTQPVIAGYRVSRSLEAVERRQPQAWSRGDLIRVRISVEADAALPWVVIADALPPGATVLGSGLARDTRIVPAAGPAPVGDAAAGAELTPSFIEREAASVQAYFAEMPAGRWRFEYLVRLNQPGEFRLPPTRVEAMYAPDARGELPVAPMRVQP